MPNSPEMNSCESVSDRDLMNDKEYVDNLVFHLTQPCRVGVDDTGNIYDRGKFYLNLSREALETIKDEAQKERLQNFIDIYTPQYEFEK
ncbi:MAG: hypothetical protein WCP93_04060 [Candidatus Berkelbacteria bacterium]